MTPTLSYLAVQAHLDDFHRDARRHGGYEARVRQMIRRTPAPPEMLGLQRGAEDMAQPDVRCTKGRASDGDKPVYGRERPMGRARSGLVAAERKWNA
jgi:hypothetical protein